MEDMHSVKLDGYESAWNEGGFGASLKNFTLVIGFGSSDICVKFGTELPQI
jgi:hypothetical protein